MLRGTGILVSFMGVRSSVLNGYDDRDGPVPAARRPAPRFSYACPQALWDSVPECRSHTPWSVTD